MLTCALGFAAQAQWFPGQYPGGYPGQYPPGGGYPGRYPPGQYPPQGGQNGPPVMHRRGGGNPNAGMPTTTYGMLRVVAGRQFVMEADDHRVITYRMSSQTSVQRDGKDANISAFQPGDQLVVDSTENDDGYFTATAVRWDKAGTPEQRAAAAQTWDLPKLDGQGSSAQTSGSTTSAADAPDNSDPDRPILRRHDGSDSASPAAQAPPPANPQQQTQNAPANPDDVADNRPATQMRPADPPRDADDPGPPVLKRAGQPGQPRSNTISTADDGSMPAQPAAKPKLTIPYDPSQAAETARRTPPPSNLPADDPVIARARQVAAQYEGTLPNFFCQQMTTRYQSDHPKTGWDAIDVVTADVAYEDGHETYKNIKIGNTPTNKAMEDIGGTRSTGEFSSVLVDLLSPDTAAIFRREGSDSIHSRPTWIYDFEVPRERSHWRVEAPSQLYYPSYKGSIWIDKSTYRVLRIEQQARNIPVLFPFDTVETATDYDYVRLSTPTEYLLPVDAEVLSCMRGTSDCSRNRIEFRNYRKFGAETSITFDGKQ